MPTRLQLVIPCYNEASRLDVNTFVAFVTARSDLRLLFVDDGSTDSTPQVLEDLAGRCAGRVDTLLLPRNGGKARAVQRGMAAAIDKQPELVGYWDADLATPLDAIDEFISLLDTHSAIDIVIGSRVKLLGRRIDRHAYRHYAGRVFATAASLALGLDVYDTQCGAKIFRLTPEIRRVFATPFLSRWVFDVEILARYTSVVGTERAASSIYELPLTTWTDVPGSKVKMRHGLRALWDIARIWRGRA
ncbi:MAG TPA: glycosyltransferase [Vicinamibacterales bacterium]|nr:glycosyltransferase [Vicinamibacterales bacterium]